MTLTPYLDASAYIQVHVITALLALTLGPFALYGRKRDHTHKIVGYIWISVMVITALTSFWIREFSATQGFSPVHLLSIFSLATVVYATHAAIRKNIIAHKRALTNLYYMGTWGAFIVNFLPGRLIPTVFFDGGSMGVFMVAAALIVALIVSSRKFNCILFRI